MTKTTIDPVTAEVTQMLLTAINAVYTPGAVSIDDGRGNPPTEANNYLMSEDGTFFSGEFTGADNEVFPFVIRDNNGVWGIEY